MRGLGVLMAADAVPEASGCDASDVLPRVLPAAWRVVERAADGAAYARGDGLKVIASVGVEEDGRRWLHVSCSRAARLPSYDDLCDVKALFIGADREAYQVFARRSKHVNIMPHCLHLWCCLEGPSLPDFTRGGDSI